MPDYRVRFYKELEDSTGHTFNPRQGEVTVTAAANEETAIAAAKREFERLQNVCSWQHLADSIECEELSTPFD